MCVSANPVGIGCAAGCHNHHIGFFGKNIRGLGKLIKSNINAQNLALFFEPVDDASEIFSPRDFFSEENLSAESISRLEQHHPMTSGGAHSGGFKSCGTPADNDDLFRRPV